MFSGSRLLDENGADGGGVFVAVLKGAGDDDGSPNHFWLPTEAANAGFEIRKIDGLYVLFYTGRDAGDFEKPATTGKFVPNRTFDKDGAGNGTDTFSHDPGLFDPSSLGFKSTGGGWPSVVGSPDNFILKIDLGGGNVYDKDGKLVGTVAAATDYKLLNSENTLRTQLGDLDPGNTTFNLVRQHDNRSRR